MSDLLPDPTIPPPRPAMPPLASRPGSAGAVQMLPRLQAGFLPPCQAWGTPDGVKGLVQRDPSGLCATFNGGTPGNRVTVDVQMHPAEALELIMALVAQLGAWKQEFGQGSLA